MALHAFAAEGRAAAPLLLAAVDRYLLPARRPSSKPAAAAVD